MEGPKKKIHCILHLDGGGEIVCFCPYEESLLPDRCVCREEYDCPEAFLEITILPKSRPSEQINLGPQIAKVNREVKNVTREIRRAVAKEITSIKKGLSRLEKDMKKKPIR